MQKSKNATTKNNKNLPAFAPWLVGYVAGLCACVWLVYFWRVAFYLGAKPLATSLTLAAMGVFSALYFAVFLICRFAGKNFCLHACAIIFLCGLLFCFATAPLQAPDENKHFLRANAISRGQFNYNYNKEYPKDVQLLVQHFAPKMAHDVEFANRQLAPHAIAVYTKAVRAGTQPSQKTNAPVMFMLLPFLHQGAFMAFARLVGFGPLGQMYAGRIANLVLYSVMCYFALANASRHRGVLLSFMLLPISLFMAGSCSYDGTMLAFFYLMLSYLCKDEIKEKDVFIFALALALITYIKLNNVFLVLMLLLVPKTSWRVKQSPRVLAAGFAGLAILFWWGAGFVDGNLLKIDYPALPRGSGEASAPLQQAFFVLQNPARFLATATLSIYEGDGFLFDLGRFGWMDLKLPLAAGLSLLCLVFAATMAGGQGDEKKQSPVLGLLFTAGLYAAAVLLGMYVLDTDYSSIRITGQQPRYFLPAFALVFLAGGIAFGRVQKPRIATGAGEISRQRLVLAVCATVAVFVAVLLFQNYYIGRWMAKPQGGWQLINLFGRQ